PAAVRVRVPFFLLRVGARARLRRARGVVLVDLERAHCGPAAEAGSYFWERVVRDAEQLFGGAHPVAVDHQVVWRDPSARPVLEPDLVEELRGWVRGGARARGLRLARLEEQAFVVATNLQ